MLTNILGQIHELRSLVPNRLLAPLAPIIRHEATETSVTKQQQRLLASPRALYLQLSQAVREGIADLEQFEAMWRSVEMKEIWEHVAGEIKKNDGRLLQPTGMWERDYGLLLADLVRQRGEGEEEEKQGTGGGVAEDAEAAMLAAKNWRQEAETFSQKEVPGVRIMVDSSRALVGIALVKAGILIEARADADESSDKLPEWVVSSTPDTITPAAASTTGVRKTKLEMAICDWLNYHRPRRWDITYLLVSSIY